MTYYIDGERRGIRRGARAAIDELDGLIVKPMLAADEHERRGFAALIGACAAAVAVLYVGALITGRLKGWW